MPEPSAPFLFTPSFETSKHSNPTISKILVSSLSRSLLSGSIHVFRNHELPLFKVERRQVEEAFVTMPWRERPVAQRQKLVADGRSEPREYLFGVGKQTKPESRQWVIIADAAGLALRNIDHLIPPDLTGPYRPPEVNLLWAKAENGNAESGKEEVSPGLWAVRGEHLPMVLERWKSAWGEVAEGAKLDEAAVWSRVVRDLPLRKKPFEKGEVYAPRIGAVNWEAVSRSAFVTVPDWPEEEARKFLQALYFGTYFGDETGMLLNILDV